MNVELEEGANESSGEDDEESSVGSRIPIPAESLIDTSFPGKNVLIHAVVKL